MNIQSTDGLWYRNPAWGSDRFAVQECDDHLILMYKGRVTWPTARRVLPKLGIKAKLDKCCSDTSIIFDQKMVTGSVFRLRLVAPIPKPECHEGAFAEAPDPLFNGTTLSWKRSGKRYIKEP